MKTFPFRPAAKAFTLIELLVVISIIAILASLGFGAAQGALQAAKKASAKNDMGQIAGAIQAFYTEYGRYPIDSSVTADSDAIYGMSPGASSLKNPTDNDQIINVLQYSSSATTAQQALNPRQIKFLEIRPAKDSSAPKSGTKGTGVGGWYDPWGFEYIIFIDADYAGDIAVSTLYSSKMASPQPISVGVACAGYYNTKNNLTATAVHAFTSGYDLISWQ